MAKEPNEKQIAFVEEYIKGKTAYESAILAGYKDGDSAYVQGCRLLKNESVINYMKQRKEELQALINHEFVEASVLAKDVLVGILKNKNASDADKIKASRDILDRAGHKPKDEVVVEAKQVFKVTRKKVDTIDAE